MTYIYVDNFRGFTDTVIPLKPVNFLIGENSTGKTSILALLNLLSSHDFWFSQDFNSESHEFGGFKDILSVSASDQSEFTIGLCRTFRHTKTKKKKKVCYLASYHEVEGLPNISYFSKLDGKTIVSMKSYRGSYKYFISKLEEEVADETDISRIFHLTSETKSFDIKKYKSFPEKFPSKAGLIPTLSMLNSLAEQKKFERYEMLMPIPLFTYRMAWLAPIRTRPKRTYNGYGRNFSPEGEHTPYVLRKQLSLKQKVEVFRSALERFGAESGLYKEVIINKLGKEATSPFEVLIVLTEKALRINSVGYGVSQVLPLLVEMLVRPKETWFAIQQPEVHLHPKAQAALGDLIFQMSLQESKYFLIETHTDFTVDRFRLNYRKHEKVQPQAQILFFERIKDTNKVSVIPILQNGEYPTEQPAAFRDFFLKEQMKLLGV